MAHAMFSGGSDGAAAFAMPSGFGLQTVGRMVGRRLERLPGVKRVGHALAGLKKALRTHPPTAVRVEALKEAAATGRVPY